MDLPTCPSCGQSVLDDDVEECPFCGESMTGKPVAKKPTPATAAPEKKASEKKSPKDEKPAKAADEDNPFGEEVDAGPKAIQASPKKMKGRTHQVVCPMCETEGFVPKKAAGKNVKCANKECMVPVFTAPALEPTPDAESEVSEKPQNNNMLTYSLLGVFLIGAAVFTFFYLGDDGTGGTGLKTVKTTPIDTPPIKTAKTEKTPVVAVTKKPTGPDYAKLRNRAFAKMEEEAITPEGADNRSIPLCRRLMADGYSLLGDDAKRDVQLQRMASKAADRPSLGYYNIVSKLTSYWRERTTGDLAGAKADLQAALESAATLVNPGSEQAEVAAALATALAADGQSAEARKILAPHDGDSQAAQLAAFLHICRELELANHNGPRWGRPPFKWNGPQQVAVTVALIARGLPQVAQDWADGASTPAARADCLIAFAEAQSLFGATVDVDAIAAKLSSAFKAVLYSRIASRSATNQRPALVKKAQDALANAAPPAGLKVVGWQQVMEAKVPDSAPYWAILRAAVEIARLQPQADRWKTFETAREKLDAMAPSTTDAGVLNNLAQESKTRVQNELLGRNLASEKTKSARADLFKEQCTNIANSTQAEYNLQGQLLMHAFMLGFRAEVLAILEADVHIIRTVPITWYSLYRLAGDATAARSLKDKGAPLKALTDFEKIELASRVSPILRQIDEAKRILGSDLSGELLALRQIWHYDLLIAASQLDGQNLNLERPGWEEAFLLIKRSHADEKVWREYALELLGIRATRTGHGPEFIELIESQDNIALKATETASALHGFVVGTTLIPPPKPEADQPAKDEKDSNQTPSPVGG